MATLPFLHDIGEATGWFTQAQLMNMLAVSESTPGPIGINMATYVGFTVAGVPGAVIATLGEVTPSIIVILIIAALLRNFRENRYVDRAFYGLRPASTGLIGAACVSVVLEVLTNIVVASPETGLFNQFQLGDGGLAGLISWPGLILAAVLLALTNWVNPRRISIPSCSSPPLPWWAWCSASRGYEDRPPGPVCPVAGAEYPL